MPDARSFLQEVDDNLDFVGPIQDQVLDELFDHIEDSIEHLVTEGWDPRTVESEAVRRMGDPETLARSITRAHQTRRRLLATAGGGVLDASRSTLAGVLLFGLMSFAVLVPIGIIAMSTRAIYGWSGPATTALLPITWAFAAYHVGRSTPFHIAMRAHRSMPWARRVVATVGLAVAVPFFFLYYRIEQSIWTVPVMASVPVWLWIGVRHSPAGTMRVGFDQPSKLALLASALVLFAMLPASMDAVEYRGALAGFTGQVDTASLQVAGRMLPADPDARDSLDYSGGSGGTLVVAHLLASSQAYAEIHAEIWRGVPTLTALEPGVHAPLAIVRLQRADHVLVPNGWNMQLMGAFVGQMGPAGDADELAGSVDSTMYRTWGPALVLLIGTGDDGARDVLAYDEIRSDITFRGSVVEWLTAR